MKRVGNIFAGLTGLLFSSFAFPAEFLPAQFGDLAENFIDRLSLPELDEGQMMLVRCAGSISNRGKFSSAVCYENEDQTNLSKKAGATILRAMRVSRIHPALVDGVHAWVWYNFSVLYKQDGPEQSIQVVDNHLINADVYGMNYTSAQRYDRKSWRCRFRGKKHHAVLTATISASGEITETSLIGDEAMSRTCRDSIVHAVEQSKFIPATIEGKPVSSTYAEIFFNP
ncbi:MAG: hypothetical protein R3F50_11140 [Gammaproteobacteria bacterium]